MKLTPRECDDAILILICQQYMDGMGPTQIQTWLKEEFGHHVNREGVYPMLREAAKRGILVLHAQAHEQLQQRLRDQFDRRRERIHVSGYSADGHSGSGKQTREFVSRAAARRIVELIHEVSRIKSEVSIGLGGGGTVMCVARELADALCQESYVPDLRLHAVSSGFDVKNPWTAPTSFFGYFERCPTKVRHVALFAPPIVRFSDYEDVKDQAGVKESFQMAEKIDIVVTSLASAEDEHCDLNRFMRYDGESDGSSKAELQARGWKGDAIYRSFNAEQPIDAEDGNRAVSLFELHELVELAKAEDKHVVLVAAPCGICSRTKEDALLPLLIQERLRIWSDVFMDMGTARLLVERDED